MKYKCPICGCEEFYEIRGISQPNEVGLFQYELEIYGDAYIRKNELNPSFSTRVCKECGHVDLYKNPGSLQNELDAFNKKIAEKDLEIKSIEKQIESRKKQQEEDQKRELYLEKQLKNDQITIKQQKEYIGELQETKARISKFSKNVDDLERLLSETEAQKYRIADPHIKLIK